MLKHLRILLAASALLLTSSPGFAQFTAGQTLTATSLNAALATKTTNSAAAITGGTITGLSTPLPVASGGTGRAVPDGSALDSITGFTGTGFLQRTGAGTYVFQTDPLPVSHGGTGATTATAALTNLNAASLTSNIFTGDQTVNGNFTATGTINFSQRPTFNSNTAVDTGNLPTLTPGRLLNVQILQMCPLDCTYTPTPGTNSVIVDLIGGGGGSAGSPATAAGQCSLGGAGTAGAYIRLRLTSGFSGLPYQIGLPGLSGSPGQGGVNGGDTTFGVYTAGGGYPGNTVAATTSAVSVITATLPIISPTTSPNYIWAITGNTTTWGFCAPTLGLGVAPSYNVNPLGGVQYGYGARGTVNGASAAAKPGFAGGYGAIVVYEYN